MSIERRLTHRLTEYWKLISGVRRFPEIEQFNSAALEDIWGQCLLLSIGAGSGISYKYEYMGKDVVEAYGQDLTGMTVDYKVKQFPGSVVLGKLDGIVTRQQIEFDEGHLLGAHGRMIKYRACFLPFGNEKKGLTHIIIGLSFRVF